MKSSLTVFVLALLLTHLSVRPAAAQEPKTSTLEYVIDGVTYRGFLALPAGDTVKLPGVLVVHEWWGLNDYAKRRAVMLAELGYAAFACDMYGEGKVTQDKEQAAAWSGELYGKPVMRQRARAGLALLAREPRVDPEQLLAIGYCFGGTTVMQLAFDGAPVKGVVSFHGNPLSPAPQDAPLIKARFLLCHGAVDPFVEPQTLDSFHASMRQLGVDYTFVAYKDAVHSFTNPAVDAYNIPGGQYQKAADERSWSDMQHFFKQVLGR